MLSSRFASNGTICVRLCDEKLNIDYLIAIPERPARVFMCMKSVLIIIIFSSFYLFLPWGKINFNICISLIDIRMRWKLILRKCICGICWMKVCIKVHHVRHEKVVCLWRLESDRIGVVATKDNWLKHRSEDKTSPKSNKSIFTGWKHVFRFW